MMSKSHRHGKLARQTRAGQVLVLFLILLPAIIAMLGLAIDGGMLMLEARSAQNAADAAALSAATQLRLGNGTAAAINAAEEEIWTNHQMNSANVIVNCPPQGGPHQGDTNCVEVLLAQPVDVMLMHIVGGTETTTASARAVAGLEPATVGGAIVVLDPDPAELSIAPLPLSLPSLPSLIAGLEVLGLGETQVHGSILVNTRWGGVDENGDAAGDAAGPPHAIACTPIVPLTTLKAEDIRVVGGVDDKDNYRALDGGKSPLRAGRLSVPDPFADLPVPTVHNDPINVRDDEYGGVNVIGLPIGPSVTLSPGVYDWINVVSGRVTFESGIYIIRGEHPVTKHRLKLTAGIIEADGVMFYLTDSEYSPATGLPDSMDEESEPPAPSLGNIVPSVIVNIGLLGSSYSPLDSPGSPFDGMMFYQRRHDRRPLVFVQENLLGAGRLEGSIYAKWGHIILAGKGTYNARFVSGTMRVIALLDMEIAPTDLLPPAKDVFLME